MDVRRAVVWLGLCGVILMGFFGSFVDRVIFQPEPGVAVRPHQLGFEGEEVYLESEDGVRLHAFYLPAPGSRLRGSGRALLFLHGNAGNASHRLPNAGELAQLGTHVLLLDYRGYGLSEGEPEESGVYADARAGLAYLGQRSELPEGRIVVFGRSLGGAIAVDLARDRPLAGVILESTFSSAADVARGVFGPPGGWLVRDRFDSLSKIGSVRCPLLFFHGDRDEVVAFELGRRLYAAAPEPKSFEVLRGAGHNDTTIVGGRAYFARIAAFLDEVAPARLSSD